MANIFIAYPNNPEQLGIVIEQAIKEINSTDKHNVVSWKAMNIAGQFIPEEIFKQIAQRILVADITELNYNVIYEVGYAIGQKRHVLIVKNSAFEEGKPSIQEVGIFDTLGYIEYQNSSELITILSDNKSNQPFKGETKLNLTAPVFIMETPSRTDLSARIISRVKKANYYYRTFDPVESPRLSAHEAIVDVSESYGIVVQLLNKNAKHSNIHNLRAAFIAGLAKGMEIPIKIIQLGFDPVPVDYRDTVNIIRKPEDVDDLIAELAHQVIKGIQEYFPTKISTPTFLEKLDIGASSAENETKALQHYYLATDAFFKALKGEVQVVTGRKGTGKSAIFYQIVNKERSSSKNLVVDLQPEGYKLLKFKEQLLDRLEAGTFQHTIMAFWEYLLLLEVANRILQADKHRHLTTDNLREPYSRLEEAYNEENFISSGDFSERMYRLMNRIADEVKKAEPDQRLRLSSQEVTGLIHMTNIKNLKTNLLEYLKLKERVWILFDNIDKGWPPSGLTDEDVLIIRCLIDAASNLKRYFEKTKVVSFYPLIFLRSDVYFRLVLATSDRQKEAKVSLDWTDKDLLTRLIELRIVSNDEVTDYNNDFKQLWHQIAISHYKGEDSFNYLLERCLMRPRFLINLINHCKSFAVNLNHSQIIENDITKGLFTFSADVLTDLTLEIRDLYSNYDNILASFYLAKEKLSQSQLVELLAEQVEEQNIIEEIIEILLWYGFLGVQISHEEIVFIYDLTYNIELLKTIIRKKGDSVLYVINPAFIPSLRIKTV